MQEVLEIIREFVDELNEPEISHFLTQIPSGKMLRSRLICQIAKSSDQRHRLSAVVEMIHLASLLHDDVIDDSVTRRGVATIGATEGSKTAIMIGDIFYSKAYSELVSFDKEIAKVVANAVTKLSIGELMDVRLSENFNSDRALYEKMIDYKTAALIEASCESAAILVGKDRAAYREFGRKLGIAFQVIDDLLDITQDEATLGKPALNDLSEGKVTLPMIDLYQSGNEQDRAKLKELFKEPISTSNQAWLIERMEAVGALASSRDYATQLANEAKGIIEDEKLAQIADKLIDRIY